jgi:hypothetical protein
MTTTPADRKLWKRLMYDVKPRDEVLAEPRKTAGQIAESLWRYYSPAGCQPSWEGLTHEEVVPSLTRMLLAAGGRTE